MFDNMKILHTASLMARHAVQRHAQIAENIANANTPGYKAKDLEAFSETYARSEQSAVHGASAKTFRAERIETPGAASPNGNTVSLEDQMARSSAATRDHDTALTIYSKTLSMLRSSLGGR